MTWTHFLKSYLRQSTYALTVFAALALLAEYLTPGSVTPFVDPLPVAVLALSLLSADAVRRQVKPNIWMRIIAGLVLIVTFILLIISTSAMWNKTDVMAVSVMSGALFFVYWQVLNGI